MGTWSVYSKAVLITCVIITMFESFEYLRVVESFSYIVTMIRAVLYDLRVFCLFFAIVILSFSGVLDVFGRNGSEEYQDVGPVMANIFATLRLSLGDFDFTLIEEQELFAMQLLFWFVWIGMVFFSSLVFLNFIIAEVGNSYQICKENINKIIFKERASLIAEAEDLHSKDQKENDFVRFPPFIVSRNIEWQEDEAGKEEEHHHHHHHNHDCSD